MAASEENSKALVSKDGYAHIFRNLWSVAEAVHAGLPIETGGRMVVNQATMALLPRYIGLIVNDVIQ